MTLSAWQATVQDANGNIVPSAEVTVLVESTGLPATIYSSRGGAALSNPFFSDVNGFAQFYANKGEYRITATNGVFSNIFRYVRIGAAGGYDVQSSPTDATAGRLLAVAAFGLGGDPILLDSGDDLNALSANTKFIEWTSGSVPTNAPSTNCQGFTIEESAGSRGYQRAHDRSTKISYERSKFGGTWSAWQPFYTGANYQPETFSGLGFVVFVRNNSGGSIAANATVSGSSLQYLQRDNTGSGVLATSASGTWKNVSGAAVAHLSTAYFVRVA